MDVSGNDPAYPTLFANTLQVLDNNHACAIISTVANYLYISILTMRIAFVGKGGSGKTTVSSLFARHLAVNKWPVLAMDADINQHFAASIGMPANQIKQMRPMGIEIDVIKEYLRGTNPLIHSNKVMVKTTPPGNGSRLLKLHEQNPVFDHFIGEWENVRCLAVGEFTEDDLGIKCYHSKVAAVELILNHLIDTENEYVVVDMTAGADSFASGLFTKFDMTVLVVEPTIKSVSVYEQYKNYAKNYDLKIKVIANKIENEDDIKFIKEKIGDDIIHFVHKSSYIRKLEKGQHLPIAELENENREALEALLTELNNTKKDWAKFYQHAIDFHVKNANSWASLSAGEDLTKQIDPNFDILRVV